MSVPSVTESLSFREKKSAESNVAAVLSSYSLKTIGDGLPRLSGLILGDVVTSIVKVSGTDGLGAVEHPVRAKAVRVAIFLLYKSGVLASMAEFSKVIQVF